MSAPTKAQIRAIHVAAKAKLSGDGAPTGGGPL